MIDREKAVAAYQEQLITLRGGEAEVKKLRGARVIEIAKAEQQAKDALKKHKESLIEEARKKAVQEVAAEQKESAAEEEKRRKVSEIYDEKRKELEAKEAVKLKELAAEEKRKKEQAKIDYVLAKEQQEFEALQKRMREEFEAEQAKKRREQVEQVVTVWPTDRVEPPVLPTVIPPPGPGEEPPEAESLILGGTPSESGSLEGELRRAAEEIGGEKRSEGAVEKGVQPIAEKVPTVVANHHIAMQRALVRELTSGGLAEENAETLVKRSGALEKADLSGLDRAVFGQLCTVASILPVEENRLAQALGIKHHDGISVFGQHVSGKTLEKMDEKHPASKKLVEFKLKLSKGATWREFREWKIRAEDWLFKQRSFPDDQLYLSLSENVDAAQISKYYKVVTDREKRSVPSLMDFLTDTYGVTQEIEDAEDKHLWEAYTRTRPDKKELRTFLREITTVRETAIKAGRYNPPARELEAFLGKAEMGDVFNREIIQEMSRRELAHRTKEMEARNWNPAVGAGVEADVPVWKEWDNLIESALVWVRAEDTLRASQIAQGKEVKSTTDGGSGSRGGRAALLSRAQETGWSEDEISLLTRMIPKAGKKGKGGGAGGKPSGGQAQNTNQQMCRYGKDCNRADCYFQHPPGWSPGGAKGGGKKGSKEKRASSAPPGKGKTQGPTAEQRQAQRERDRKSQTKVDVKKKPGIKDRPCGQNGCDAIVWASRTDCHKCGKPVPPWKGGAG